MSQSNESKPLRASYEQAAYAAHEEELLDEPLAETFPASDPVCPA